MNRNEQIKDLLTRGVADFVDPDNTFRDKLEKTPEKIVIKFGIDPTKADIHLGHAVIFRRLRKFQELGCKVIFLIGDFTAQIGDPTGKDKVRADLAFDQVQKNVNSYLEQVGALLENDPSVFRIAQNSVWFFNADDIDASTEFEVSHSGGVSEKRKADNSFNKTLLQDTLFNRLFGDLKKERQTVTLRGLLWTLKSVTFARLKERDMFQERIKSGRHLFMHEMLYPVLQGIDSYLIANIFDSCDLEVGGTDQTFNMLMGRDVMKINAQKPQSVMSFDILEGIDGKEKMSKSLDNYISIHEKPNEMFGKIMSIPDNLIIKYFTLCTDLPLDVIRKIDRGLKDKKTNPRDIKIRLANEIVKLYHNEDAAKQAEENFINTFSKREIPADAKKVTVTLKAPLVDILIKNGFVASKGEFRRLVQEGAITFHGKLEEKKIVDPASLVDESGSLKIGKRRFLHITVKKSSPKKKSEK